MATSESGQNSDPQTTSDKLAVQSKKDAAKTSRELRNIKQSPSYVIGKHLANSYSNFFKFASLPVTLPLLAYRLISGKYDFEAGEDISYLSPMGEGKKNLRHSVVFFPTNGVGFGHFTRALAVARRLKRIDENLEIVFITTMPTLHLLSDEGFLTYHMPPRYKYSEMEPRVWNTLIEEMIDNVFSLHRPKMFIFDGAFPYRGMLNSIKNKSEMTKIWMRRGMFKVDSRPIPSASINHFDAIIRPGDSSASESVEEVEHDAKLITCNPITLLDEQEFAQKGELRRRLGIPDQAVVCYLQLGAGKINDISDEINFSLDSLSKHPQVITVVGESILGNRISYNHSSVRILRDYPNSMFFQDFDFAILAGGYNSFHEAIQSSLPTICYPNLKTGTDDQLARSLIAEEAGCMIVIRKRDRSSISAAIDRIIDEKVREKMRLSASLLERENGAEQIAELISGHLTKSVK